MNRIDAETGLKPYKVIQTCCRNTVTSLRIQPAGDLLAIADDSGCLQFFDMISQSNSPLQTRQLLVEQGGITELCWLTNDVIAVGTTRGRIITYSSRNITGRFCHVGDVEAHGDGVSQVAVESMDVSPDTRRLVSVGEEKTCMKLWDISEDGLLSYCPTGDQQPEFSVPQFVKFAEGESEIIVGYLDPAIVKRFSLQPWQLLARKVLCRGGDPDATSCDNRQQLNSFLGNAVLLPQINQLVVFNLKDGLDFYDFPDLNLKHTARCTINPSATQGLALLKSGFLACPTNEGNVKIFRNDGTCVSTLRCPGAVIQAISALYIPNKDEEYLVASSGGLNADSAIVIWHRKESTCSHDLNSLCRQFLGRLIPLL